MISRTGLVALQDIIVWGFFGIVLGVVPLLAQVFLLPAIDGRSPEFAVLSQGALFIGASSLVGPLIHEVAMGDSPLRGWRALAFVPGVLVLVVSSIAFGHLGSAGDLSASAVTVSRISLGAYLVAVVAAIFGRAMTIRDR